MRNIKSMPNRVVFYHVFDIKKQEKRVLGPYCRLVKWPKGFERFYVIHRIERKTIK